MMSYIEVKKAALQMDKISNSVELAIVKTPCKDGSTLPTI